jgi:hypothetical protein
MNVFAWPWARDFETIYYRGFTTPPTGNSRTHVLMSLNTAGYSITTALYDIDQRSPSFSFS